MSQGRVFEYDPSKCSGAAMRSSVGLLVMVGVWGRGILCGGMAKVRLVCGTGVGFVGFLGVCTVCASSVVTSEVPWVGSTFSSESVKFSRSECSEDSSSESSGAGESLRFQKLLGTAGRLLLGGYGGWAMLTAYTMIAVKIKS